VGAIQQTATNLIEGRPWYAGVSESALIGAVSGAVAGGIVGRDKSTVTGTGVEFDHVGVPFDAVTAMLQARG
jgi:hypothetical protein